MAKTLSREHILKQLDVSEEEFIKHGASVMQMDRVFKYLNIPVRVYNFNGEILYKHEPLKLPIKRRVYIFTGMVKNNHLYLLNDNLASLQQQPELKSLESKASGNYYISDRTEPVEFKAISHIEILTLTEHDEYNLIHVDNDMVGTAHHLIQCGYEPMVKWNAGTVSEIRVRFKYKDVKKTVTYNIKSQNLSKAVMQGEVIVETAEIYNRMQSEMFKFNHAMFCENHMSQYSDVDLQFLKEYI